MTELHEAADMGDTEAMDQSLKRGCDVNLRDEGMGLRTPLILAAAGGHLEAVKLLLRAGADATVPMEVVRTCPASCVRDDYGDSPAEVAKVYGHTDCWDYLQQEKERIDAALADKAAVRPDNA